MKATRIGVALYVPELDDPEEAGRLANLAAQAIIGVCPDAEVVEFALMLMHVDDNRDDDDEEGPDLPDDLVDPGSNN